jgi:hypothetical protein
MARPKRNNQTTDNNVFDETDDKNNNTNKGNRKKTTTTITLAIDSQVLEEIRGDVEREGGQSINSKINSILVKHTFCYRYAEQQKSIIIPSKNFKYLVDNFDEDKLLEQYKSILLGIVPADLLERKTPLTVENWIKIVCEGMLLHGGSFHKFSHYRDNEGYLHLTFRHDHGIRWSRIIACVLTQQMENLLGLHTTVTILSDIIVIKILERKILSK